MLRLLFITELGSLSHWPHIFATNYPGCLSGPTIRAASFARCHISACAPSASGGATGTEDDALEGDDASRPGVRALSERVKKMVAYNQGYRCATCDILLPPSHEVDHVVPVALGGHNGLGNLQAMCRPCHMQKTRDQRHTILDDAKKNPTQSEPSVAARIRGMKRKPAASADGTAAGAAAVRTGEVEPATEGRAARGSTALEVLQHRRPGLTRG